MGKNINKTIKYRFTVSFKFFKSIFGTLLLILKNIIIKQS